MVTGFARGAEVLLAFVLLLAGVTKLSSPTAIRQSITRRLPSRLAGRSATVATVTGTSLGAVETAAGLALIARPEPATVPLDLMVTVLCIGVVLVAARARRRGAACGRFGSFSPGISGTAESARATTLALMAGTTTLMRLGASAAKTLAIGAAAAAALVVALAASWRPGRGRPPSFVHSVLADRDPHPLGDGWRWAGPWERHRVLRVLRRDPAVTEVVERTSWIRWSWRHARVTLTSDNGGIASVVVPAPRARLHVFAPEEGLPAVVGYTSRGVYVPKSRRAIPDTTGYT